MIFAQTLLNSTAAARGTAIVLLLGFVGLTTQALLQLNYGAPAPAQIEASPTLVGRALMPQWMAGGASQGQSSAASGAGGIKLLGLVSQGRGGYALVQVADKRAQVLQVGQSLPDGTRLDSVQGKTATLTIAGQARVVALESGVANTAPNAAINPNSAGAGQSSVIMNQRMPGQLALNMPDPAAIAAQQAMHMQQVQQMQMMQQQQQQAAIEGGAEASEAQSGGLRRRLPR